MRNLVIIILTMLCVQGFAQQSSPYSRFGIGQPSPTNTAAYRAMGNTSIAVKDSIKNNFSNPAALGDKMFSSLDFGIDVNYRSQKDQLSSTSFSEGGISYLAYSFPVNKKRTWGMALGVQPQTYKGYDVTTDLIDNRYIREYDGDGNTYKFFWQNGAKVADGLTVGIDAGILFGNLEDKTYNNYGVLGEEVFVSSGAYSTGQTTQQKLRGVLVNLGAQYTNELQEDLNLTIGGTYGLETDINNEVSEENFQYVIASSEVVNGKVDIISRTITSRDDEIITDQDLTIPQKIGFGAAINKKEKWSLAIDAKMTNWDSFTGVNDDASVQYRNSLELGLGGSFIPDFRNPKKAYEGFEYRYGGYYNQTYLTVANTDIQDYGISLGVGLPVRRNIPGARIRQIPSSVDVGIIFGQTGTIDNNLVQDSYIKGTIGLSLNDIWFQKKKYD